MPRLRVPPQHPLAAALLALSLALGACGGASTPDPEAQVRQTIRDELAAQSSGDGAAACALLTPAGQRQLVTVVGSAGAQLGTAPSCAEAVGLVRVAAGRELMDALARARVEHVVVDGDRATADVVGGAALPRQTVVLVRSAGGWRITRVPGLPGAG